MIIVTELNEGLSYFCIQKKIYYGKKWNWQLSGIMLGAAFLIAVWAIKPIGVSTQFVILNGIIWNAFDADLIKNDDTIKHKYSSSVPYFNKGGGKYAKNISNPLNYSFVFVISMVLGGFISSRLLKTKLTCVVGAGVGRKDALFFIIGGLLGALVYSMFYGTIMDTFLFEKIAGGKATLANTGIEKYPAIIKNVSSLIISGSIAILFMAIPYMMPKVQLEPEAIK